MQLEKIKLMNERKNLANDGEDVDDELEIHYGTKNYSTIRSILKKEQGEKIAPYVFKINDTNSSGISRSRKNYL